MDIIIPSLGRAGTSATAKWIQEAGRKVYFAVHLHEINAYANAYPWAHVWLMPETTRHHTGKLRKHIMEHWGGGPFFFCDDDIRISIKGATDVAGVFNTLEHHMNSGASMAGLGQQLFSNMQIDKTTIINDDPWALRNQFVATVYGIDPGVFHDCPLEDLAVYEDVALVIHGIQRGGGTITSYAATHSNMSPAGGGCNVWRNKDITISCLERMVELYPDICSIRETSSSTHSQQIGVGLRVAWSKIRRLQ